MAKKPDERLLRALSDDDAFDALLQASLAFCLGRGGICRGIAAFCGGGRAADRPTRHFDVQAVAAGCRAFAQHDLPGPAV